MTEKQLYITERITMKLTKKTIGNEDVFFENGVKKYIYYKDRDGGEYWKEFDSNDNLIHYKDSDGSEYWREFDKNNNEIHSIDSDGDESWSEYDSNNNLIHYKDNYGSESWSNDNPNNPKNVGVEVDIQPFTFTTEKTMNKTLGDKRL